MRVSQRELAVTKLLAVGLAAAAVLLAGCGGGSETEAAKTTAARVVEPHRAESTQVKAKAHEKCPESDRPRGELNIALDGWEAPETVGILMATERGYFAKSGLEADTLAPPGPTAVISDVVEGGDDLGVSHEPEVVLAKEEGAPIVILGSLIPQPTAALIWLGKSKIDGVAGLKGKTIGIPGLPFQESLLRAVLAKSGLTLGDVKVESVGYELVPDLVKGRVDAIFGRSNLQGAEIEARGLDPVITPVQDLGVPAYDEIVLIARADCASEKPRMFRDFMSGLARGTAAAVDDPKRSLRALLEVEENNPETGRKAMKAQLDATLPLLSRDGRVSPARARALVDWMHGEEMITRKVLPRALFTNAYLESSNR
ncbi:MAG: ABC transporter substrate-binding protein [Solirubrobacterales bacterium]